MERLKNAKIPNMREKKPTFFKRILFLILFIVLLPFIIISFLIKTIFKKIKKKKWEKDGLRGKLLLIQSDISQIDIMEGYEFEEYLKTLFFYLGYSAALTTKSKDYGADIVLTKDNETIIVQAKRYNKLVGIKSVQEILGAVKHYKANETMVVTNSHFTYQAETLARENQVRLIDREELIELYTEVKQKLKLSTKESELVDKFDRNIQERFPNMI